MRVISAPGIIAYVVAMTVAGVDWVMSLEPTWFSTMYGVLFVVSQGLMTLAFTIIIAAWIARQHVARDWLKAENYHDLGKLMFAFTMLWAYTNFSQFLIIWSGNLPEETPWYLARLKGGWQYLAIVVLLMQFVLPFLILLSRNLKRNARRLAGVALLVLAARLLDLFWLVTPAFSPAEFSLHWIDLAAVFGVGGLWLSFFVWQLRGQPLLPLRDPELAVEVAS